MSAPVRSALSYGLLSARRRLRTLVLPAATVATGAFLLVLVVTLMPAVREQAKVFGDAAGIGRAAVAMSVIVLLVGALEVAITATRSIAQRTREIGVLGSFGVPPRSVVCGLIVEPVATAVAGSVAGALLGAALASTGPALGWIAAPGTVVQAVLVAVAVSTFAAAAASAAPVIRTAYRPPLASLTS